MRSLAWCGRIVVVGFTSGGPSPWSDYRDRAPDMVRRAQQNIFRLWGAGKLKSPVTAVYPLEQASAALCCVRERGVLGKIALVTSRYSADNIA